jgi:formate hydrogenlyase subunit 4
MLFIASDMEISFFTKSLNLFLMLITATFFIGIVTSVKSYLSGRMGAGVFQAWKDVYKLSQKGAVFSSTTTFITQIAPTIQMASVICAMLVVPFGSFQPFLSFEGDFIFFAYVLAVGKFFMILAALDTGSPFEGMGANREALYSLLAEPAFFIFMGSFAMITDKYSFYEINKTLFEVINQYTNPKYFSTESVLFAGLATYLLVQIAMVENSRLPFDDPKTHLELTMVHEVMVLDMSGVDLAMVTASVSLKFAVYGMLIANFLLDASWPFWVQIVIYFTSMVGFAVTVGLLESFRGRSRMKRNPMLIFSLTAISILIFFGVLIVMNKFQQ